MTVTDTDILSSIDAQIASLEQARNLLTDSGTSRRGKKSATAVPTKRKRKMSPEARERIAAAQRKRWAA